MVSWTSPRTWVAGENPTAATLNTHLRDNVLFLFEKIAIGNLSITPSAPNTPTSVTVTFPFTFASAPIVVATAQTGLPGTTVLGVGADSETTTNFRCTVTRTTTTETGINWIAVLP